jgi:anti-sigma factor RsiW
MSSHEPCPRIEALSALVDDELRGPERLALERHAAACTICAPVLADLRQLRARFASLPTQVRDFDVAADVDRRIAASSRPTPRQARPARARWWQAALLLPGGAAALSVGLWLGGGVMPVTLASAPAAQMAAFSAVPPGALCPVASACGGSLR